MPTQGHPPPAQPSLIPHRILQGWPAHKEGFDIKGGQQVTVTTCDKAEASSSVLPISYPHFAHMCQPGDTLFIGRYLVNGADQSSLYLEVSAIRGSPCCMLTWKVDVMPTRLQELVE